MAFTSFNDATTMLAIFFIYMIYILSDLIYLLVCFHKEETDRTNIMLLLSTKATIDY